MKIRKIIIENNPILGNINLDFTNTEGNIYDTILLIGENGTGKSTILEEIIFNFTFLNNPEAFQSTKEIRRYHIVFTDKELEQIIQISGLESLRNEMLININYSKDQWKKISIMDIEWKELLSAPRIFFQNKLIKDIFKSIYSSAEINFSTEIPTTTSNKKIDEDIHVSIKSSSNLAKDITQLLVDIVKQDDTDDSIYMKKEIKKWIMPNLEQTEKRITRFQKAYSNMFEETLNFNYISGTTPIFKKWDNEFDINKLSSWEKQIVFRWWFLLKDKNSIHGAIVLIDEPEISMHPIWQQKVLNFYKILFTDSTESQTSQIFISTHSPYVLQTINSNTDCVFIFPWWHKIDNIRSYIWSSPSLGVVNYHAFNLPSIELHDELYWYIQDKTQNYKIPELEIYLASKWLQQNKSWTEEKKWIVWNTYNTTIQTFIRNKVHHPENKTMQSNTYSDKDFKDSIDQMVQLIQIENL